MFAIYRKEMRSYFINPIGYVYLGVFLVFSALLCCYTTLIAGSYDTASYFMYLIFSFMLFLAQKDSCTLPSTTSQLQNSR